MTIADFWLGTVATAIPLLFMLVTAVVERSNPGGRFEAFLKGGMFQIFLGALSVVFWALSLRAIW